MNYTPTNWKNGDVITSEKLNKVEGGVADAQLPDITIDDNDKLLTSKAEMVLTGETQLFPETELSEEAMTFMSGADVSYFIVGNAIRTKIGGTDYLGLLSIIDLSEMVGAPMIGAMYISSSGSGARVQIFLPDETIFTDSQYAEIAAMFPNGRGLYVMEMGLAATFGSNIMSATIGTPEVQSSKEWSMPSKLKDAMFVKATAGDITSQYFVTAAEYKDMLSALSKRKDNKYNKIADAVVFSAETHSGFAYLTTINSGTGIASTAIQTEHYYEAGGSGSNGDYVGYYATTEYMLGSSSNSSDTIPVRDLGAQLSTPIVANIRRYSSGELGSVEPRYRVNISDLAHNRFTELCMIKIEIAGHSGYYKYYYFIEPIFSGDTVTAYRFASGPDMIDVDATTGAITEVTTQH